MAGTGSEYDAVVEARDRGAGAQGGRGRLIRLPRRGRPAEDPFPLDELVRVGNRTEALVIQGLLAAHGIQAVLRARVDPAVYPFTVGEQGEVSILVPRPARAAGRRLLGPVLPRRRPD